MKKTTATAPATTANDEELKAKALDVLSYCRGQILQKHPFTGAVSMSLELIPIRDFRCSTAMTDGLTIYFDIDFLSRLSQEEREFVIAHEVWHNVMMPFARRGTRDMTTFNYATDFEVNQLLADDGFIPPSGVLFPNGRGSKFNFPSNLSAEEYYDLLMKDGNGIPNSGSNGKSGKGSGSGKSVSGQFDEHFDKNRDYDREAESYDGKEKDKYGKKGVDKDFTPGRGGDAEEARKVEKIREAVIGAAQQVERSRGTLPGSIAKIVKDLLTPKVNWREQLATTVTSACVNRSNWNTPNKRFAYSGTYLPSHTGDSVRLAIGIDTSGSCAQDCEKFLTEINAIAQQFEGYELHIIQCDTQVQDVTVFDESNPLDPASNGIEFKGFGGTALQPIFDYIDQNELDVDQVIVFTDGYCETFDHDIDLPVTWVITGGNDADNLKIGNKIALDD